MTLEHSIHYLSRSEETGVSFFFRKCSSAKLNCDLKIVIYRFDRKLDKLGINEPGVDYNACHS